MEIVGSVAPDEVPEGIRRGRPPGIWAQLCERAIADFRQQRVTVVRLKDQDEIEKMMNNIRTRLRGEGFQPRPVVVKQDDELRVFLELVVREPAPTNNTVHT